MYSISSKTNKYSVLGKTCISFYSPNPDQLQRSYEERPSCPATQVAAPNLVLTSVEISIAGRQVIGMVKKIGK